MYIMKLKQTIGLGALAVCLTFGAYSCKSKEKVATNSEVGEILQDMPCEKNGKSE